MPRWGQLFRRRGRASEREDELEGAAGHPAQGDLGQLLRRTREEEGISLEEIEEHTRIRAKYLLALEEARYDDLPTPSHTHGFLRNYARYLGLDMDEVEALYAKDRAAHHGFEPRIFHPKNISLIPKRPLLRANLILAIVVVILIAVLGFAFWQYGWPLVRETGAWGLFPAPTATVTPTVPTPTVSTATLTPTARASTSTPTPVTEAQVPTETAAPTATPEPPPTATPTLDAPLVIATPTPEPTSTPTPTPTRTEGVVVSASFVDRVWLQVRIDGQDLPGELYEVGEEKEWVGQSTIYMICGNAGGIEVTVNGEEVGVLGERAEVVERTWGPQGVIIATPEGEATPTPTTGG